ncbi:MAG: extracellular solute-binding protein [bacterium]
MKRWVCIALCLALMAGLVGVLGAQQKVQLRGYVRDYTLTLESPWKTAIETFKKKHPNVEISVEGLPYDDIRNKTLITAGAGQAPDIIQVDCIWLGEYAKNGVIIDATDWLEADPALKDDLIPQFAESAKWNGRTYGLWINSDVRLFGWWREFFRDAGIDPYWRPDTWEQVAEVAQKVQKKPAVWGFSMPLFSTDHTAERWYMLLYSAGGSMMDKDFTKVVFNSPAGVRALQWYADAVQKWRITPIEQLGIKDADLGRLFWNKKYVMYLNASPWGSAKQEGWTTQEYWDRIGIAPQPKFEGGEYATCSGGWVISVSKDSKYPELTWEFIKLATSPDNVKDFLIQGARVPTRKSLLKLGDEFKKGNPDWEKVVASIPYTHFRPWIPEYNAMSVQLVTAIQKAVAGEASPKAALDAAAKKINEEILKR